MNILVNQQDRAVIEAVTSRIRRLSKNWNALKKAKAEWDFKTLDQTLDAFGRDVMEVAAEWRQEQTLIVGDIAGLREFVRSSDYPQRLEEALKGAEIPFQGTFPHYECPPFKLMIAADEGMIRLSLGRKQERTTALSPERVAVWVAGRYRRIVGRRFDHTRFCKELLAAYEWANQHASRKGSVLWGHPVSLRTIYKLLTIRQSSRQDYPESLFIYELGRVQERFNIVLEGYRFELGFERDQSQAFVIVNSHGRESRVSTLTVHKEG